MEEKKDKMMMIKKRQQPWFWSLVMASVALRMLLIYFSKSLNLASRPEVSTPVTSLRRLAEGYWLKQSSISPYAGSMYHGSPLLLLVLGPLTAIRIEGLPDHIFCSLVSVMADFVTAILIRSIGKRIQKSFIWSLKSIGDNKVLETTEVLSPGDIAALVYLWNPFTILSCVGLSTSPIENLAVVLSLYGACTKKASLAAFGWVIATHLSLYPAILIVPVVLLLIYGPDTPPKKLFIHKTLYDCGDNSASHGPRKDEEITSQLEEATFFSWRVVIYFFTWVFVWTLYVLALCGFFVKQYGGLGEMFRRTYGFILTVEDLSPNIGVLWYFFAEVFDFFRNFFLIVFHLNILFMLMPLAIRLKHRPLFLAFVYVTIASMLKSYPSVGDAALYLGLLGLFINELADMQFSFFLFCGYAGVSLLSPVMHNLWIWRGTGNANFYFATAMAYACLQILLVVESVSAMLNHDRKMKKRLSSDTKI
ncbi:phosphatidylinositol glycan anchor biosynthesis class U protein-like [Impatiens glandulifera]|uniref:phosphatidylinositol glycan anchor biosynthesis class U protein-like n=1 Tax=Impatiens glandulifera TaxID=253017 RepID=UPI001FB094E7|nr:phosphatidylinositol glycan anchor biosynthesis class U protein-like [Impatiens glandulifera]XP_047341483.1 phosphatidylinositol glycan anchor biosynthesis class U protein-like [Impatiens glandulifera]